MMDGQTEGWMDGCTQMYRWMDGQIHRWMNIYAQIDTQIKDAQFDGNSMDRRWMVKTQIDTIIQLAQ